MEFCFGGSCIMKMEMIIDVGNLNKEQAKGLANFFFDIAKALVLGTVVINAVSASVIIKFATSSLEILLAVGCIRVALNLLKD